MDYPQWLLPTFIRSARAAGATASDEEVTAAAERLIRRWSAPDRHHHDVHHLGDMLSRITTLAPETHNPELVRLAAFYHGCVFSTADKDTYTRNGGENEIESARVARAELSAIGIDEDIVERVASLIEGIKRQPKELDPAASTTLSTIDIDKLALRDAHLGSLAAGPQRYTKYLDEVAREYSHVPIDAFLTARREIIGRLLARRQIFLSPLGRQWEAAARDNLEGELERIESRLAALHDPAEPPAEWENPGRAGTDDRPLSPEEYSRARAADAVRRPQLQPVEDEELDSTLSSLETIPDMGPAAPRQHPHADEKKRAEREEIERKMQERLARRQSSQPQPIARPPSQSAPSPHEPPPSAPTPEWRDSDDSARAGFEREPDW